MAKSERLDLRLTSEQKAAIDQAAELEGTTAAGFTVAAVMERASEALHRARTLTLPGEVWDDFVATLDADVRVPVAMERLLREPSVLDV